MQKIPYLDVIEPFENKIERDRLKLWKSDGAFLHAQKTIPNRRSLALIHSSPCEILKSSGIRRVKERREQRSCRGGWDYRMCALVFYALFSILTIGGRSEDWLIEIIELLPLLNWLLDSPLLAVETYKEKMRSRLFLWGPRASSWAKKPFEAAGWVEDAEVSHWKMCGETREKRPFFCPSLKPLLIWIGRGSFYEHLIPFTFKI